MLRSSMVYRRLWYVKKRNITKIHTMLRLTEAALILSVITLLLNFALIPNIQKAAEQRAGEAVSKAAAGVAREALYAHKANGLSYSATEMDFANLDALSDELSEKIADKLGTPDIKRVYIPLSGLLGKYVQYRIDISMDGDVETAYHIENLDMGNGYDNVSLIFEANIHLRYSGFLIKGRTTEAVRITVAEAVLSDSRH